MTKLLISLIGLLTFAACGSQKEAQEAEDVNYGTSRDRNAEMQRVVKNNKRKAAAGQFTDSTHLRDLVSYLSSDEMKGRETGSNEIGLVANFIEELFIQNNLKPFYPKYRDTLKNTKAIAYNMVGYLEGTDRNLRDEYILVGAHYDHIGLARIVEDDSIANGANDNASGTATVLELARYFGRKKINKRSMIFALFSAEEIGLLGSRHMAERLKNEGVDLYLMLNFEMTGVPMKSQNLLMYMTGYNRSNLAEEANALVSDNPIGFLPTAERYSLFQRSDNYPFYDTFRIPSHTFCTFDFTNYAHYHKVTDEAEELDYEHMSVLVNKMIPIVEGLTNSSVRTVKLK